jgi:hypothetical protein
LNAGFVYTLPPVDFFAEEGWTEPPSEAAATVEFALRRIQQARSWEPQVRTGPMVMRLPTEGYADPMWAVLVKIDNNGTTFVWSPFPLPHLIQYQEA